MRESDQPWNLRRKAETQASRAGSSRPRLRPQKGGQPQQNKTNNQTQTTKQTNQPRAPNRPTRRNLGAKNRKNEREKGRQKPNRSASVT
jgi:hypothetical protein